MITKVCSSSLYNIGSLDCNNSNPFLDTVSLFLSVGHEFATFADFADKEKWEAAIKAGTIIPLHGVVEIEDQSEEPRYYEAPSGVRIPRGLGKYRHTYLFNLTLSSIKHCKVTARPIWIYLYLTMLVISLAIAQMVLKSKVLT